MNIQIRPLNKAEMTHAARYGMVVTEKAQKAFSELEAWKNQKSGTWNENAWPD